jgi:iron complex outermembrane recepter protein
MERKALRMVKGTQMRKFAFASVALIGLVFPLVAHAAEAADKPATAEASSDDEIIVTAQRRDQSLQEVPLAVTAIGGESLEQGRVNSITDLQTATPGLNALTSNRPATSSSFSLRGVGTSGNDPGLEAAVGFSVDGVYRARSGAGLGDFVDVDRVEVLRGPQGTLFGKNTTAGVIQVTTRTPSLVAVDGFMEGTVGNYNLAHFRGAVNLPLSPDKAALRVSFGYNRRDGLVEDPLAGTSYNDRDRFSISGKLLFQLTPDVEALLAADYSEADESCCQSVRLSNAQAAGGGNAAYVAFLSGRATAHGNSYPVTPTPEQYLTSVNGPVSNTNRDRGVMFQLTANLGGAKLTSISSYRKFSDLEDNDVDFTGADLVHQKVDFELGVFSQELRLQGNALDGKLDWLVGGFYSSERIKYGEHVSSGVDLNAYFTFLSASLAGLYPTFDDAYGTNGRQNSNSIALFTHNIFTITDGLHFTAGLRWTKEDKSAVSNPYYNGPNTSSPFRSAISPIGSRANPYSLTLSESAFSGTAVLDYRVAPDIMVYASYSHGYKAGGFGLGRDAAGPVYSRNAACASAGATPVSTVPVAVYQCNVVDPRFKPETVNSYEIGLRTQFFDRRLTFNVTLFDAKYQNLQLNTFTGFGFFISNIGTAESKGVEVEAGLRVTDWLRIGGNLNYLDAKYGSTVPSILSGEPALGGKPLNNAPEWSGAFTANLDVPISDSLRLFARPEVYFRSASFSTTRLSSAGTELMLPGFTLFNISGGLRLNDKWEVSAFCRNCTDKRYQAAVFSSVAQTGSKDIFLGNPAEYGVSLRFEF